ncbi:MAG: site-specific integrase [Croceibacterium sp.]
MRRVVDRRLGVVRRIEPADRRTAPRPLQIESQAALWICLSTACRIGELLMSEWRHVNLDTATWFIPKENVKGSRGKKQDQLVFLSPFALSQFRALHALTDQTRWCFPGRGEEQHVDVKSISKQVDDRQHRFKDRKDLHNRRNDNSLVLSKGINGEWTPHDLRRTAATMMQALGVTPEVIDRCQNHVLAGSRVRRHYLTHEYANEKREAWIKLGLAIESLLGLGGPSGHRAPDQDFSTCTVPRATHFHHRSPERTPTSRPLRVAIPA